MGEALHGSAKMQVGESWSSFVMRCPSPQIVKAHTAAPVSPPRKLDKLGKEHAAKLWHGPSSLCHHASPSSRKQNKNISLGDDCAGHRFACTPTR